MVEHRYAVEHWWVTYGYLRTSVELSSSQAKPLACLFLDLHSRDHPLARLRRGLALVQSHVTLSLYLLAKVKCICNDYWSHQTKISSLIKQSTKHIPSFVGSPTTAPAAEETASLLRGRPSKTVKKSHQNELK